MKDEQKSKENGERREYLTFTLGAENYAIDILTVQEIRGYDSVTRLPDAPDFIKGVINLRGTIVPVVDLRIKFHLGQPVYDKLTVMIILSLGSRTVGVVVDAVSDVIALFASQIQPPPEFGGAVDTQYLCGIGTLDERMLMMLDIERLMKSSDMGLVRAAAEQAAEESLEEAV